MNLQQTDIDFIKNLSHEMKTQDNRATAQPFGLILLTEQEYLLPDGYGDETMARWNDESYDNFPDLMEDLIEYYGSDDENIQSIIASGYSELRHLQSDYNAGALDIEIFSIKKEHQPNKMQSNFFITEKAYNEYIRKDGHNLNKPQSYGIHLTRNKEMRQLYEIIHKLADIL